MSFTLDLQRTGSIEWARVPWDSDTLGRDIYDVRIDDSADDLPSLLQEFAEPYLAFTRIPLDATPLARALTAAGFYPVETSFELSLPLARRRNAKPTRFPGAITLRPGTDADRDAVADIARGAFTDDRYHVDPAIDDARADERMVQWTTRAFDAGEPVHVLAAEDDRVLGFFHVRPLENGDVDLSLAAVHPDVRGIGVGPLLYAAVLDACRDAGHRAAVTRISADNLDVLNVYVHLGFTFLRTWSCLHRVDG